MRSFGRLIWLFPVLIPILSGCGGGGKGSGTDSTSVAAEPTTGDWVVVRLKRDPIDLNPLTGYDENGSAISSYIFQPLLEFSPDSLQLTPVLAKGLPEISTDGLRYTFEIKEKAKWDNGKPITGHDFAFTLKVIKNPLVDAAAQRPYYAFVADVQVDSANPRKFTVIADRPYFLSESSLGLIAILPQYFYDPKGLMSKFTIPQLNKADAQLMQNADIKAFAEEFNSPRNHREPASLIGSGPYQLKTWEEGQHLVLVRKSNYWGTGLRDPQIAAYPDRLVYKIIQNDNTALVDLKGQRIDVIPSILPRLFEKEVKTDAFITSHYNLYTPESFAYYMIGMSNRPVYGHYPYFTDPKVRRAMAHLVDVKSIIDNLWFGHAAPVIGPISRLMGAAYNDTLKPIPFDPARARMLLEEAGWKDSNGNGTVDKLIGDRLVEFTPTLSVPSESANAEKMALMMQESAKQAGVKFQIEKVTSATLNEEKLPKRDFDMAFMGWSSSPSGSDPSQGWHTSQIGRGGTNFLGYGSPASDQILDAITREVNTARRNDLFRQFQALLYAEQPAIFIASPKTPIAIHKRFQNAKASAMRPGFFPGSFWTPPNLVMYH